MSKQPATVKFASRIATCFWDHNSSFGVFFDTKSHRQVKSTAFFKTQWKAMGIHMCHRVLPEVIYFECTHHCSTMNSWPGMTFITFGRDAGECTGEGSYNSQKCPILNHAPLAFRNHHWKPTTTLCLQQLKTTGDRNSKYVQVCTLSPSV